MEIKLLILDVDGTLTDSTVYYGDNNTEIKGFSTKDGAVLKPLRSIGIDVVFLTGRESEAVQRRAVDLGVRAIQGIEDKSAMLDQLLAEYALGPSQCAYVGDDINDYEAMKRCAFKACPVDAAAEIQGICDYVSPYRGGRGAVRDICEKLLKREGKYIDFLRFYGVQ